MKTMIKNNLSRIHEFFKSVEKVEFDFHAGRYPGWFTFFPGFNIIWGRWGFAGFSFEVSWLRWGAGIRVLFISYE